MSESQNNSSTPAKGFLSKLRTTKKLQLSVAVFVSIVFAVLALVFDGSQITAAARLRARYPELKVIFMSGYTESVLVQDGVLETATVLLQKPFSLKKLLDAVQRLDVTTGS